MVLASLVVAGCSTVRYLGQAAAGQYDLLGRAEPIERILAEGRAPPKLARVLREVPRIKAFAWDQGLGETKNYATYAELGRDAAVWVVTASKALSFSPKVWKFWPVGSFPYLGWFDRAKAQAYAARLAAEGWDVSVRGAGAYSTLGFFEDPVLSTMIPRGGAVMGQMVNTVIHESVHASIHIPNQAYFNETIAQFIGDWMTLDYLLTRGGAQSHDYKAYVYVQAQGRVRKAHLARAYDQLEEIYRSAMPDGDKLRAKEVILRTLAADLGYSNEINNALLIDYRTYGVGTAELGALFTACEREWPRFVGALGSVRAIDFDVEQQEDVGPIFLHLADAGCPNVSPLQPILMQAAQPKRVIRRRLRK